MQKIVRGLFFGFLIVSAFLVYSRSQAQAITSASSPGQLQKNLKSDFKKFATTAAVPKATRASELAEKACEVHVKVIKLRQGNIASHAAKVEERLNKLTLAVEKYYTEKLVPAGKILPNYDALVADVSSKQAALDPLIEKIQADSEGLTCDKNQARGQFTTFKGDIQKLLKAFKDYRLSVIHLMQGVKSIAGREENNEASSSASEGQ